MNPLTLGQRKAIADADAVPGMVCTDATLLSRLGTAARIWCETKEPLAMQQVNRLLDELGRRKRTRRP